MELLKWILLLILFVFATGLIFTLFSKITVSAFFSKKANRKLKTSLVISFWGGLFKKEIKTDKKSKSKKKKDIPPKEDDQDRDDAGFFDKVKKYYTLFLDFKDVYKKNRKKIRRSIHAKKIQLHLEFGTGDAAKTGIATGAVWAGIYNVIAFAARLIKITEPKVEVVPLYNEQKCEVDGECIISTRLANLIWVVASIGISYYFASKKRKNIKQKGGE